MPPRRALSAKILGKKSPIFDIEHMQVFSPQSGRALLTEAGYERVRADMFTNKYPVHYWTKLLPIPGKQGVVNALRRSAVGRAKGALPAGNQVIVGFKPRGPPPSKRGQFPAERINSRESYGAGVAPRQCFSACS